MITPYDTANGLPAAVPMKGFPLSFERVSAWIAELRKINRITRELSRYSDRDLADMGLTRGDIPAVARGVMPRE